MTRLDALIVVSYIALIFLLSWHARWQMKKRGEEITPEGQYLADRSLTFFESICSIIATEVSALTFLGVPAFAFKADFNFLQIYLGAIVGRVIVALLFLPRVYGKGLTMYEVMDRGENGLGRMAVATFYAISKTLAIGVRLFSGSIMITTFLGVDLYVGLVATTFVTFLYTLMGGLKAVVRTDILQLALFITGGVTAHYLIPQLANQSWTDLMGLAHAAGKTTVFHFENPWSVLAGLAGGVLFDMSTHGVDQDFAQRLMANHKLRGAQWAIVCSSFVSVSVGALFLGVGALLWGYYQTHPFPEGVPNADHLFAYFIVNHFPTGLKGLMVAGALSATMSALDSTLNALSATLWNDILPKRRKHSLSTYVFIDNAVIICLMVLVAIAASKNDGLLLLGLKIQSWTAGSLLAVFFARVIFPQYFPFKFSRISVIGAYIFGIGAVTLNTVVIQGDWNWNTWFGCGFALAFLLVWSRVRKPA